MRIISVKEWEIKRKKQRDKDKEREKSDEIIPQCKREGDMARDRQKKRNKEIKRVREEQRDPSVNFFLIFGHFQ